jgi:hypothetical protein
MCSVSLHFFATRALFREPVPERPERLDLACRFERRIRDDFGKRAAAKFIAFAPKRAAPNRHRAFSAAT